ncbi:hypothetical protein [Methylomonas methanica]|uniref:Uncharacterized protein n=1 Tax=Methylomonas methanica (strain DSM 25384 / MC09) TaxID=857087 RepID=G0A004_METMM|nr:hypothetical protein [Methylomonas methanica]AEF99972.1 hypothetical protein Metme_1553 [Methylomonas methanica MC09]
MKSSILKAFLDREDKENTLISCLKLELDNYRSEKSDKGGSVSIIFNEDDSLHISKERLAVLVEHYQLGVLDCDSLEYVGDALELGELVTFESEFIRDIVFEFSNPSINGVFTQERAAELLSELKA